MKSIKYQFSTEIFLSGVVAAICLLPMAPVQAFTFSSGGVGVRITEDDVGKDFWAEFNGQVDDGGTTSTNVEGLNSRANFKVTDFTSTSIVFDILVENISQDPITASMVTSMVFRSASSIGTAETDENFDVTVSNQYTTFSNLGLDMNESAFFSATLGFNDDISSGLYLDEFGVSYDGINGTIDGKIVEDVSGTGVGQVPTPALLPGLIGVSVAALRKKKSRET